MRISIFVFIILWPQAILAAENRPPDLSRCSTMRLEPKFVVDCVRRAETALKPENAGKLPDRQRSIALTWKAMIASLESFRAKGDLSEEGERLMGEATRIDPKNFIAQILLADNDISKGSLNDAERRIKIARELQPNSLLFKLTFGRFLSSKGDFAGAQREYSAVIGKRQFLADAYLGRAEALVGLKQLPSARADLLLALKFAATDESTLVRTANGAHFIGLGREALPTLEAFLRKNPTARLYAVMGVIHFDGKNFRNAYESLTEALRLAPNSVDNFILRGRSAFVLKRTDEAFLDLEQAEKFGPTDARVFYWRGLMQKEMKKLDQAVVSISRAIELAPGNATYWYDRAAIHDSLDRPQSALEDYTKAIVLAPRYKQAHNNQGAIYEQLGRLNEAEASYLAAMQIDPDYLFSNRNLVSVYGKKHELAPNPILREKGLRALAKIFELAPQDMENVRFRGQFYKRTRECDLAVADLKTYHEWKPTAVGPLTDLGFCLSTLGRHHEVVVYLEKAIALSPNQPSNLNNLGWAKVKLGDFAPGLELAERSLKLRPDDAPTLNTRAHAKAGLGDRAGAIKDHREVLRIAPAGSLSARDSEDALKEMGEVP